MINLPGYQINSKIYESINSEVYRGIRQSDQQIVIIKVLKQDYPTPQEITRYKQEYEIIRNLNLDGVVKAYCLESYNQIIVIIFEDFGGDSLKILLNNYIAQSDAEFKFNLAEFLQIALKTADILGQIHLANIIHKDINPANIVFNPKTGIIKIIDFGISTVLNRENPTLKNPNVLEGTLAYMSPEQTGRMNRALDYRTDFYSLGITFYEMLAGQLPFPTTDALELVHCHIAKQPVPLEQINHNIPKAVADIVMKLMAKTAEERYQSAWGIKADLENCLTQLQNDGQIFSFPLAKQDISDKFQIPQKLYGREMEVATLLAAFERVAGERSTPNQESERGIEMMLVTGYSGIGKSALVQEIYKPITKKRGYFISGKFDQFQQNIPYLAIVNSFTGLVRQLLTESEVQLNQWQTKLLTVLNPNGQVIIDVIPEMELIIGKQPGVLELGPQESQNRFNLVFQNFIRVFCSAEHPLVIFLDDLQWADSATLKLIEVMMTDTNLQYLFLIGAYRDNEVNPTHPLMMTLNGLQKEGAIINSIHLAPLALEPISHLIAETAKSTPDAVKFLAELVVQKTEGNPFFVNEFLKTLYSEDLLTFDFPSRSWQWDVEQIAAKDITDNVVELMIGKIKKLPESTQEVLTLAACIGADFNLNTLSIVREKSPAEIFANLVVAVQFGLILTRSELDAQLLIQDYKFLHDRVQQAAYALIDDDSQRVIHLKIGRLLMQNIPPDERELRIFEIVDHLNLGKDLITNDSERIELAKWNLEAGKKAQDAAAFAAALQYLRVGLDCLRGDDWTEHYELALTLHKQLAEVEYLNGNFRESEALIDLSLQRVKSDIEKAEVYNLLLIQYTLSAKYEEAIKIGRKALSLLGIFLPDADFKKAFTIEVARAKENLGDREISSLIDAPEITDPHKILAIQLLVNTDPPAYFANQEMYGIIVLNNANISLQYGNIAESSKGFVTYGMILGSILGDYQSGYEFGKLSVQLSEKFNNSSQKCSACLVLGGHLNHWVKPIKWAEAILNESYQAGLESGELRHSGYALEHQLRYLFYQGNNLETLIPNVANFLQFSQKTKNQWATDGMIGFQLILLNLTGRTPGKLIFCNDKINDEQFLETCALHKSFAWICTYNIFKSQILYFYGQLTEALKCTVVASKFISYILGHFQLAEYNFYSSLILVGLYPQVSISEQKQYWDQLESQQNQMKIWADNCPENFLHKYLLVAAEMARISGKREEAMDLYDRAIASAQANDFIQDEALGNELAAKFWLNKGKQEFAQIYLKKAHYCYQLWGAKCKVEDLEEKYPHLLTKVSTVSHSIDPRTTITNISNSDRSSGEVLDLATVMKASQAISGEIVLEKLLSALMKILLENAGAELGSLIFINTAGELLIAAQGKVDVEQIIVGQLIPIDHHLPASILNYVVRTRESVVLNDASREGNFQNDPYIKANQPKSILCVPLISQGQLVSLVYLENNLMTGAFTPDRLELLKMLSSQAAIAIENAQLYANLAESNRTLEMKVAARTQELSQALDDLRATQTELIQSEKMAALGQLIAGIAHEINTPLGAIHSSAGNISKFLTQTLEQLPILCQSLTADQVQDFLALLQRSLNHHSHLSAKEERKIKRGLVAQLSSQQLKDADVLADTLVDMGIYEDIEPFTVLLHRPDATQILEIAYKLSGLQRGTQTITMATERASKVVFALKSYARYDHSGELISTQIHDSIDNVLTLYQNQIKQGVEVIKNYGDLPAIACYPDELNQVWTNIIHNALQAMDNRGTLIIQTTHSEAQVQISISDTGPGIPTEIQAKIFEPFFTTKPPGEGSGLGLDIVKKIISKHSGKITVNSEPGRTTFHILLPIQPDQELVSCLNP